MPIIKFHSAKLTLNDLKEDCEAIQAHERAKLVHLQGAKIENPVDNQTQFNQAQYVSVSGFSQVPQLKFVKVNAPTDIPSIFADMAADNGQPIFDEIVFIEGQEQRVFGYAVPS